MNLPLVVGLGSHCGDDRAGWIVVDRLRELGFPARHLKQAQHPVEILDVIDSNRVLIVCDACEGDHASGAVHRWDWPSASLASLRCRGTHDMALGDVLDLAGQLDQFPRSVEIWGVEGRNWSPIAPVDTVVRDAARRTAATIWSRYADA